MKKEIICAGFGGQGVLTAGMILAKAGMEMDKNVLFILPTDQKCVGEQQTVQ